MFQIRRTFSLLGLAAGALLLAGQTLLAQPMTSKVFSGAKVNAGTVTLTTQNGRATLTLSDDFKVPDTPDPHWQIVDSKGNTFLLQRLGVKGAVAGLAGDKINRTITVPAYVKDLAKIQIYCAWAETVLGETTFASVTRLTD